METKQLCIICDFASSFTSTDHEEELGNILSSVDLVKMARVHKGHLSGAWVAARSAIDNLESVTPGGPTGGTPATVEPDWEAALPTEEYDKC